VDPQLEHVSPNVGFVVRESLKYGASLFYLRDEGAASLALTSSRTRRRLFDESRYTPQVWMRIIPRQRLLAWAKEQRSSQTPPTYDL